MDKNLDRTLELTGRLRATNHRLAGLEHAARQPRLAAEADVEPNTKTCKRTEGASAADRVKNGKRSSVRIDDGPTCLTSFGMIAESLSMAPEKCIGDVLIDKVAKVVVVVVVVSHIQRIGCQPEKTTLHGGQSRSWSAEQGKENKRKKSGSIPPPHPPHCSFGENK